MLEVSSSRDRERAEDLNVQGKVGERTEIEKTDASRVSNQCSKLAFSFSSAQDGNNILEAPVYAGINLPPKEENIASLATSSRASSSFSFPLPPPSSQQRPRRKLTKHIIISSTISTSGPRFLNLRLEAVLPPLFQPLPFEGEPLLLERRASFDSCGLVRVRDRRVGGVERVVHPDGGLSEDRKASRKGERKTSDGMKGKERKGRRKV